MGLFSSSSKSSSTTKILFDKVLQNRLRELGLADVEFPTREVADLTPIEQQGQSQLASFVSGGSFQDPATSPVYQSYRTQSAMEEKEGVGELRRRQQLAGMFSSSPALQQEGDLRSRYSADRQSLLAQLFEQERSRDNPLTRAAAAAEYGDAQRRIDQTRADAEYQTMLQTILFPYQQQLNAVLPILKIGQRTDSTTTSTPSIMSSIGQSLDILSAGKDFLFQDWGKKGQ